MSLNLKTNSSVFYFYDITTGKLRDKMYSENILVSYL